MKNPPNFLIRICTILLLWCAISTKSMAANIGYLGTFTNQDLVSKLVKSTTFENLSMNLGITFLASSMHRELLSESQLKYEDELMKSYSTRLDLTFPEKLEIANIAGFANWEQYMEKMELINALRAKLYLEFPALRELAPAELQNVLKEAVIQIDVAKKLKENPALRACLKGAGDLMNECMKKPGIYYRMARKVTGVCFATLLTIYVALLIEVEISTAGTGTVAALAAFSKGIFYGMQICTSVSVLMFGDAYLTSENIKYNCQTEYNKKTQECVAQHKP